MSNKPDDAVECFMTRGNCAQAVFSTYAEEVGFNRNDALRVASAFGAGMGRRQETCGAVTGAFMVIGSKYGKIQNVDAASVDRLYGLVRAFADRFIAKHGTVSCKELLSCDLKTPEGQKYFKENNFKTTRCARYVHDAAEIVDAMLDEEAQKS